MKQQILNPVLSITGSYKFTTREQSEKALTTLFIERDIPIEWTFDDVMREFIDHPVYKAVATAGEKKRIFEKFQAERKEREALKKVENFARNKFEFACLINMTPGLSIDSPWK